MSKKPPFVSTVPSNLSFGYTPTAEGKSREGTPTPKNQTTVASTKNKVKSLEELRMEDFLGNTKETQSGDGDKSEETLKLSAINAICERITKLEIQHKALTEENAVLKMQIDACLPRANGPGHANLMPYACAWSLSPPNLGQPTPNATPRSSKKDNRTLTPVNNASGSLPVVPSKGLNTSLGQSNQFTNIKANPWLPQNSTPRQMVHGQAENANPLPTVQSHRWLFVTRFARTVTNDHISDYMAQKLSSKRRPICISLTRPEDPPNKVASFRVDLLPEEFEEAMAPNFWDKGVLVSEFKFPNKSKNSRSRSSSKSNKKFDASF